MADQTVQEEREGRSSTPPGRESRDDWRGGRGHEKNGRATEAEKKKKSRSRSRSPLFRRRRRSHSPNKEFRYSRDGTNTTSREPHLERARIFVGNIESHCHRKDLVKLFSQYGDVLGASVHKGYAFVQMDRERTANKAINFEDNKMFMGSKIHVEFSQAALKAGAKFERLSLIGSPPRMQPPPPPLPPIPSRGSILGADPYIDEQERQREERLARILQMERELALLRSREGDVLNSKSMHPPSHPPMESHHDRDNYSRRSPGPTHSHSSMGASSYQSSYSRDGRSNGVYGGDHQMGADRSRGYYSHNSPPREYTTRNYTGGSSSSGIAGSSGNSYRDPVSYPTQYSNNNNMGGNSGGYSSRSSAPAVGYSTASASKAKSNLPPGWPQTDTKPLMNRAPFSVGGSWS